VTLIAPSSHRTCSTLKLPPEAGEALSFLLLQYFGALTVLVFGGMGLQTHRMRRRDVITLIAGTAAGCLAIRVFTLVAK
jgi:hypothetical protein